MIPYHPYAVPWATPCVREGFAMVLTKAGSIDWSPGLILAIAVAVVCLVVFVLLIFLMGSHRDTR